jgi:hypothetical protein
MAPRAPPKITSPTKPQESSSDEKLLQVYMGGLKKVIKHELFLKHPANIMEFM